MSQITKTPLRRYYRFVFVVLLAPTLVGCSSHKLETMEANDIDSNKKDKDSGSKHLETEEASSGNAVTGFEKIEDSKINFEKTNKPKETLEQIKPAHINAPINWNPNPQRTPKAIHLTYQHDPYNTITIQWRTEEKNEATYKPKAWLVKATDISDANPLIFDAGVNMPFTNAIFVEGVSEKYCPYYFCDDNSSLQIQWKVEVTLPDPESVYYYRVGTWENINEQTGELAGMDLSPAYHFVSGNKKDSKNNFTFGFASDTQSWMPEITNKVKQIREKNGRDVRFWLFGGDLTETGTQRELWNWFDALSPLLGYYPLMPVLGNHDIVQTALLGEFSLPKMNDLPTDMIKNAWSFNFGNAHFVGINSYSEATVLKQLPFLEHDLQAAGNDPAIDWKFAIFHHPAYSSSTVHGSTEYIQRLVVPLLDRYGVDMVFSGHDHDYERTKPLKAGKITNPGKGTVYIVSGGFYSQKSYPSGSSDFTAKSADGATKSYVIINISNKSLNGFAYNGNHEVLDNFTITK